MPICKQHITLFACIYMLCNAGCKEVYSPPAVKNNPVFLVVDGFLTSAPDSTYITLTHTRNISDTTASAPESYASVTVEGETSGTIPLVEIRNGVYGNLLSLDSSQKYRLVIRTINGVYYNSDFIPFKITPQIDSLSWKEDNAQVSIQVSTHDPSNNTRYYRWTYEETWKYHTYFLSYFNYVNNNVVVRGVDHLVYNCWSSAGSADIQVGTSAGLSQDLLSNIVFHNVSKRTEKIYIEYSILAKQYALTRDQFDYWTNLKKTSEQLGSIFDAQPSQLTSNIHCITNPSETVLGYLSASSITNKRIFIKRFQLSNYDYSPYFLPCQLESDIIQRIDSADKQKAYDYLEKPGHLFTFLYEANGGYNIAPNFCADCQEHGGTSVKPDFWP